MRKILSTVLVLLMMVTLMVPCAMAAEANEETRVESTMDANGGGFTNKLLSAEKPEAAEEPETNLVANVIVFAVLAVVVGVSVAMVIDKKKKLYK